MWKAWGRVQCWGLEKRALSPKVCLLCRLTAICPFLYPQSPAPKSDYVGPGTW